MSLRLKTRLSFLIVESFKLMKGVSATKLLRWSSRYYKERCMGSMALVLRTRINEPNFSIIVLTGKSFYTLAHHRVSGVKDLHANNGAIWEYMYASTNK